MAFIYHFKCDNCDEVSSFISNITWVVLANGSEKVCPEPGGYGLAEQVTGKKMDELEKEDRIVTRRPYYCVTCGDIKYYGRNEGMNERRSCACRSCGQKTLYAVSKFAGSMQYILSRTGPLHNFLRWFGVKRRILPCSNCTKGSLIPGTSSIT